MDERKYFILGAILRSYIESAEPIGSRTLQRDFDMGISAATIRNEMSDLEHLGYLMKAHTSSGRIPSEQAYRWYVDELRKLGYRDGELPVLANHSLLMQSNALEQVVDNALKALSDSTNQVSFCLVPGRGEDELIKVQLTPVGSREAVLQTIYCSKAVNAELVHLSNAYMEERFKRAEMILQEVLEGRTLGEIDEMMDSPFFGGDHIRGNLISELVPVIRRQVRDGLEPKLRFTGLEKLYQTDHYGDWHETTAFIDRLTHGDELIELLCRPTDFDEPEVYIGNESRIDYLEASSIIASPIRLNRDTVGKIGVIGPTRMYYRAMLSDVDLMGRYISSIMAK